MQVLTKTRHKTRHKKTQQQEKKGTEKETPLQNGCVKKIIHK
jgi:hypothetical protein